MHHSPPSLWRAVAVPKALLVVVAVAGAAHVSEMRAGPEPAGGYAIGSESSGRALDDKNGGSPSLDFDAPHAASGSSAQSAAFANVHRLIELLTGRTIQPRQIRVVASEGGPVGWGQPVVAFFVAGGDDGASADLYRLGLRISAGGVPLVVGGLVNLTRTRDGDERLLDVRPGQVLYGTRVGGRFLAAVQLDFRRSWLPDGAPLLLQTTAAISSKQLYGTWRGPRRVDFLLARPARRLSGSLTPEGFDIEADRGEVENQRLVIDAQRGHVVPADGGELLLGAPPQREVFGLLADAARRWPYLGTAGVAWLESALFSALDGYRVWRHRWFGFDRARPLARRGVGGPSNAGIQWPPESLEPFRDASEGGGRWVPATRSGTQPLAGHLFYRTFLRPNADRPFLRVHLVAFDMRRLSLRFVSGARHPESPRGLRGSGVVAPDDRNRLVAAFNGGFKIEHGAYGAVEAGRVIVPPVAGAATVAIDRAGYAVLGAWDRSSGTLGSWVGLRQNLVPLVADAVVNPTHAESWGQVLPGLDEAHTPRSALGVTEQGQLVYGWSAAASALDLGQAMRRARVVFALHLDMNPGHTGMALYRTVGGRLQASAAVSDMSIRRRRWLSVEARDFFYVVGRPILGASLGEGWRSLDLVRSSVTDEPLVAAREVPTSSPPIDTPLIVLSAQELRGHIIPGLGEPRPATGLPLPTAIGLPSAPVAWLPMGLPGEVGRRDPADLDGLIASHHVWRAPREGRMTFAIDSSGAIHLGRWGRRILASDSVERWSELRQGDALVDGGRAVNERSVETDEQVISLGIRSDGGLLYGLAPAVALSALSAAFRDAGAAEALVVGRMATNESVRPIFLRPSQGRLEAFDVNEMAVSGFELAASTGSVLAVTRREPRPTVSYTRSFKAL